MAAWIDVKPNEAKRELTDLRAKLGTLRTTDSADFVSWELQVRSALARALGEHHHVTEKFTKVHWTGPSLGDLADDIRWFQRGVINARGILDAAISEVGLLGDQLPVADESGIDAELWEHIAPEINAGAWGKVASNALIFTEDRVRRWADRPHEESSEQLAVNVFGDQGDYKLGKTASEKRGWQLFAQGIAKALRNVDTHRIQDRDDIRRYALGVVGACSLLLTQMRHEHTNRFIDTSPADSAPAEND